MFTGRPEHLTSFDYVGVYRYFHTFCTESRRPRFTTSKAVDLVLSQIVRAAEDERFAIAAYCFMPDHVHLLIAAVTETSDCRRFIKAAKQYSGFYYSKEFGHRLWQRYGYERVLRNDEATLGVAKYILENPLRAGLASRVDDHPFLGSKTHSIEEILAAIADNVEHGPAEAGHYVP